MNTKIYFQIIDLLKEYKRIIIVYNMQILECGKNLD